MATPNLDRCRQILEVSPEATREEITSAYHHLKRIHGAEPGLAIAASMEEFSLEARQQVMAEIEEAYALLKAIPTEAYVPEPEPVAPEPDPLEEVPGNGSSLRRARTKAGLTLDQVAQETCVRREYLKALEDEEFQDLTRLAPVNIRGYLTAFANTVGVPADAIVPVVMERFATWLRLTK